MQQISEQAGGLALALRQGRAFQTAEASRNSRDTWRAAERDVNKAEVETGGVGAEGARKGDVEAGQGGRADEFEGDVEQQEYGRVWPRGRGEIDGGKGGTFLQDVDAKGFMVNARNVASNDVDEETLEQPHLTEPGGGNSCTTAIARVRRVWCGLSGESWRPARDESCGGGRAGARTARTTRFGQSKAEH
jgi:hypothetical protein